MQSHEKLTSQGGLRLTNSLNPSPSILYHICLIFKTKRCSPVRVDEGMDCFKTKRIRKDIKVFGLYRSMIEKEAEKINSAVLKYIIMFVVIISLAGEVFKFVFLNMIFSMGKPKAQVDTPVVAV